MSIKEKTVEFTTTLPVPQIAEAFRRLVVEARSGFGRVVGGVEFGTPNDSGDNPFEQFESQPVFRVYGACPRLRFSPLGPGYSIHMYVWEQEANRRVLLGRRAINLADVSAAEGAFRKIVWGFQELDANLAIQS